MVVHKHCSFVGIRNPDGTGQAEPTINVQTIRFCRIVVVLPLGPEGLLVAGQLHIGYSHGSPYRVMSICMAMGGLLVLPLP